MGLADAAGNAVFPNAELIVHEQEAAFWLDQDAAAGATERIRRNIGKAKTVTAPYRDRMRRVRDGEASAGRDRDAARRSYARPHRLAHSFRARTPC